MSNAPTDDGEGMTSTNQRTPPPDDAEAPSNNAPSPPREAGSSLDLFLREALEQHPTLSIYVDDLMGQKQPGEDFAKTLVRLGVLSREMLGTAMQAAWGELKLPADFGLFDEHVAFASDTLTSGYHEAMRRAEDVTPDLKLTPKELESPAGDVLVSTQHILLRPDHNFSKKAATLKRPAASMGGPRQGMKVGNLLLLRRLDSGGTSEVWKAWHQNLEMHMAVKFLRASLDASEYLEKFFREARLIAALNHRNIIRVYDCGQEGGHLFIEEEYVKGSSLGSLLRLGAEFSVRTAMEIALGVALGLGHAHRRGILHRDVKLDNIMATIEGEVKLMDFGLAQPIISSIDPPSEPPDSTGGSTAKKRYSLAGTPAFMAPELLSQEVAPSPQADIYALGVCLYLLCAGELPFKANTVAQMFCQHLYTPAPVLSTVAPRAAALDAVVARTLAKDPAERYQTYNELVFDLLAAMGDEGHPSVTGSYFSDEILSHELGQFCRELS
jgi:hypothetical protein